MIVDELFCVLAAAVVLLTGISKGGFGGALTGVAVPLLALAVPTRQAASIMLPLLCLSDVVGFRVYYGKWDTANLKILLPGAFVGIGLGAVTFGVLGEQTIRLLVGCIAVVFTLYNVLGPQIARASRGPSRARGTLWASISGYTSFVAHSGGPPAMVYLLPQRLDKTTYVATTNLFFMVVNAVKLLPYALLGQFSRTNLLTSLALAPLVPLGVRLGLWLHRRVNQVWFYRAMQACMLISGLQLMVSGLTGRQASAPPPAAAAASRAIAAP